MKPAISVVMPVYNGLRASPHYFPEAIESVLEQTVSDFELIIVDDCSDDDYGSVKEHYDDSRIRWVRLDRNVGPSAARNAGVEQARGEIIAFIDADDRWYPERLKYGLKSYGDYIMTYSDFDEINPDGSVLTRRALASHQPGRHPIRSLPDLLERDVFVLAGTCLIGKEVFLKVGGFDPELLGYEDGDFFLRMFQTGPIGFLDRPLIQYRQYPESYKSSERMDLGRCAYFRKLARMFPDGPGEGRYWLRDKIAPMFSGFWFIRMRYTLRSRSPAAYRMVRDELGYVSSYGPLRLRLGGAFLSRVPYGVARVLFKVPRFKYMMGRLFLLRSRRKKQ